jgi:hypothetical protein
MDEPRPIEPPMEEINIPEIPEEAPVETGGESLEDILKQLQEDSAKLPEEQAVVPDINASGESAASMEAINRLQAEQATGRDMVRVRRDGTVEPLLQADRVDATPYPGDTILQRGVGADPTKWTVRDSGKDANIGAAIAKADAWKQTQETAKQVTTTEQPTEPLPVIEPTVEPETNPQPLTHNDVEAGGWRGQYGWAMKNKSDIYADVKPLFENRPDIDVGKFAQFKSIIRGNLASGGATFRRLMNDPRITWVSNLVDEGRNIARKNTDKVLNKLDTSFAQVKGYASRKDLYQTINDYLKQVEPKDARAEQVHKDI